MSEYTTNLNLLKKDPETDGNDYFNIQTMLNDNWDKIDAGVAAKETPAGAQAKVDNLAGAGRTTETVKGNADAITALNQTVASHSAEAATTSAKGHIELATTTETTTGTDTTRAVTPAGLKAALDALIAAAPSTLDTLNELAAALGDDPNFATTITNLIAGKANAAHAHATGDITSGTLPITRGGTGATTAAGALTALGITATAAELNILDGVTGLTAAELTNLGGITATAAELNKLSGIPVGLTATEIGYLDGVTGSIQTQLNAKATLNPPQVNISTSKQLALTDVGTVQYCTNASAINIGIPANASVAFPLYTEIAFIRAGAGTVTFASASGVTIQSSGGKLSIKNQYESVAIRQVAANVWELVGSLSA